MRATTLPSLGRALLGVALLASPAQAFETTKTLPRGRFNVSLRGAYGQVDGRFGTGGAHENLAQPLSRSLTFADIIRREHLIKARKLEGVLLDQGMDAHESLGHYTADMRASVQALAPVLAYGVSDRFTLALAVPYLRTRSDVRVGFRPSAGGAALVRTLESADVNQRLAAEEARSRLSQGSLELARAMDEDGYRPLRAEAQEGVGDVVLASRWRIPVTDRVALAHNMSVTAPTGRTDDPDRLTDVPLGEGQWNVGTGVAVDHAVTPWLTWNSYGTYQWQLPGRRRVRLATAEEPITKDVADVGFDGGDAYEGGTSLQAEAPIGLTGGLGWVYRRKFGDRYRNVARAVADEVGRRSDMDAYAWEAALGYSTIPAFQRREVAAPLTLGMSYRSAYKGRNAYRMNLWQWEMNAFF